MIKKTVIALSLAGALANSSAAADVPENIAVQREGIHALTLMLQLHAEGMQIRQRTSLDQSLTKLQGLSMRLDESGQDALASLVDLYRSRLAGMSLSLENGEILSPHAFDKTFQTLVRLLDQTHKPQIDNDYVSVLMIDYLTMRYAFHSYIGIPGETALTEDRYFSASHEELLEALDADIRAILSLEQNNSLKARWTVLHHLFNDAHEDWTRTRSGNPYAPIMVILNASALSTQLIDLAAD